MTPSFLCFEACLQQLGVHVAVLSFRAPLRRRRPLLSAPQMDVIVGAPPMQFAVGKFMCSGVGKFRVIGVLFEVEIKKKEKAYLSAPPMQIRGR